MTIQTTMHHRHKQTDARTEGRATLWGGNNAACFILCNFIGAHVLVECCSAVQFVCGRAGPATDGGSAAGPAAARCPEAD